MPKPHASKEYDKRKREEQLAAVGVPPPTRPMMPQHQAPHPYQQPLPGSHHTVAGGGAGAPGYMPPLPGYGHPHPQQAGPVAAGYPSGPGYGQPNMNSGMGMGMGMAGGQQFLPPNGVQMQMPPGGVYPMQQQQQSGLNGGAYGAVGPGGGPMRHPHPMGGPRGPGAGPGPGPGGQGYGRPSFQNRGPAPMPTGPSWQREHANHRQSQSQGPPKGKIDFATMMANKRKP